MTSNSTERVREGDKEAAAPVTRLRLWWVMALLLLVNILNFVDRQIPFILAESIKRDLQLSDTQIGVLGGIAFAIVYSTLGIPLARLGERIGRKWVLSGSLLIWSALTALGGLAQNYVQLVGTRLGVAAGEAGSTPAAHSLISSYFPPGRRGLPLAIFSLGVPLGTMLGLFAGGYISQMWTWRQAMIVVGLPGILLAILTIFTLREPAPSHEAEREPDLPLSATLMALLRKRSFRHMAAGIAVYSMGANATIVFTPAFLMRTYGMSSAGTGLSLGLLYGIAGVAGTLAGGALGDWLGKRDQRWRLWLPALGLLIAMPFTFGAWFATSAALSVLLLAGPKFANLLYIGPIFVALHSIAPVRSRATASAFLIFFNSLIGVSFGPLITGMLSDWLEPTMGVFSLRYALCFVLLTQIWAAWHFWISARSIRADAAAMA